MSGLRIPTIIGFLAGVQAANAAAGFHQWFERYVFKRISITGQRQLGFHKHNIEGDRDAYNSTNYFGQGSRQFTDIGHMTLDGKNVFGFFNFNMTLSDNRFQDPQSQRVSIDYNRGPIAVNLGDIRGNLINSNKFAAFNKQLYGAMANVKTGRLNVKTVFSESKGSARTVPMQGNNSAGPYYLRATQIINDSEEIRVDGVQMKPGIDYVINYEIGSITFVNRIIAPTSTIVATFEVLGFNSNKGTIQGGGATYDLGKYGRFGLTAIEQKTGAAGGLSSRIEEFQGYGASITPYTLQFEPLPSRPIIVRLNGVIQQPNVHYVFNPELPSEFRFLFDVPQTSIISVTYTPKPTSTADGDRRVIGFDYRLPLGADERNYISYSQATGELLSSITPMKGTARGIDGAYNWGPFEFRGSVRDVPASFVSVETRGFNRNDKAIDLGLNFNQGNFHSGLSHLNSNISIRRTNPDGSVSFTKSRSTSARAFANYAPKEGQKWSLEHVRTASRFMGADNKLDTTSLSTSKAFGKINTRLSMEHQDGFGPISNGLTTTPGSLQLDTVRLNADYSAGPVTIGAKGSVSAIEAGGKTGKGNDVGLAVTYEPSERFNVQASYNVSNSGQLATLGQFQNGIGVGYENNGFSGGPTGSAFSGGATDFRNVSLVSSYKLNRKVSLDAQFFQSRSSGLASTNSETSAYGFGLTADMGRNHLLSLSLDQSKTNFIGTANRSDATTINANFVGSPAGPWSYRLGASMLISGGTSPYKQDSMMFDAFLGFKVDQRQRASLVFQSGLTKGYLPQRESFMAAVYEYQLFQNVALVGSYKMRKVANQDTALTSGAYRSNGFDIELSFNFGG